MTVDAARYCGATFSLIHSRDRRSGPFPSRLKRHNPAMQQRCLFHARHDRVTGGRILLATGWSGSRLLAPSMFAHARD